MATATSELTLSKRLTRKSSSTSLMPCSAGQNMSNNVSVKVYTLDKAKSLQKKGNSCLKEHMKYELKQDNYLVIELSTAAYEMAKQCLRELVSCEDFKYAVEKRDSLDKSGANVDTCIRVFNKKSDGSCGRMLKFVINFYHTTSQILVNGSKTDLFISNVLNRLCAEMKTKCSQLDILNINIASALNSKPKQTLQVKNKDHESNDTTDRLCIENDSANDHSDSEIYELCPICGHQAYGKVVQCGECGDWYHFECININDNVIDTLGDDDFVCRSCTENLLYTGTVHNQSQAANEGQCTHENSLIIQDNIMTPVDPIQIDSIPEIETAESRNSTPENETIDSGKVREKQ